MPLPSIDIASHPLLEPGILTIGLAAPLGELATPPAIAALRTREVEAPMNTSEEVRQAVRDLLRVTGFKPTGRSKPSSEYLVRACEDGKLGPINLLVDLCNGVSLHSGLPISVIDLDRATEPLAIEVAPAGSSYVFNASGQEIEVSALPCLRDAIGPCANAVKDAQRTKTTAATHRGLVVVWGTRALTDRTEAATAWLAGLAMDAGATVSRSDRA